MSFQITRREKGFSLFYPGSDDTILEEQCMPGECTVLYTRGAVTLLKGHRKLLDGVLPAQIENSDTSQVFADMDELRKFFADTMLTGGHFHSEIVAGTAGISWEHFESAPCTELLIQNNSEADIIWNKGDGDRYLLLPAGQSRTIGGITNAYQVQIMLSLREGTPSPVTIYAEAVTR